LPKVPSTTSSTEALIEENRVEKPKPLVSKDMKLPAKPSPSSAPIKLIQASSTLPISPERKVESPNTSNVSSPAKQIDFPDTISEADSVATTTTTKGKFKLNLDAAVFTPSSVIRFLLLLA
jgi:hypothetical protein